MKKIKIYNTAACLIVFFMLAVLTSCEEKSTTPTYDSATTYLKWAAISELVPVNIVEDGESYTGTVNIEITRGDFDKEFDIVLTVASGTANDGKQYSLPVKNYTVAQGENTLSVEYEIMDDILVPLKHYSFTITIESVTNGMNIGEENKVKIDFIGLIPCPNLTGSWVYTAGFGLGLDPITITDKGENKYEFSDLSGGVYGVNYDTPAYFILNCDADEVTGLHTLTNVAHPYDYGSWYGNTGTYDPDTHTIHFSMTYWYWSGSAWVAYGPYLIELQPAK